MRVATILAATGADSEERLSRHEVKTLPRRSCCSFCTTWCLQRSLWGQRSTQSTIKQSTENLFGLPPPVLLPPSNLPLVSRELSAMVVDWVSGVRGVAVGRSFVVEPLDTDGRLHTGALLRPARDVLRAVGVA